MSPNNKEKCSHPRYVSREMFERKHRNLSSFDIDKMRVINCDDCQENIWHLNLIKVSRPAHSTEEMAKEMSKQVPVEGGTNGTMTSTEFVDSRTPEERLADSKIESTTTTSSTEEANEEIIQEGLERLYGKVEEPQGESKKLTLAEGHEIAMQVMKKYEEGMSAYLKNLGKEFFSEDMNIEKWEEVFDREFTQKNLRDDLSQQKVANYIKDFITILLSQTKREAWMTGCETGKKIGRMLETDRIREIVDEAIEDYPEGHDFTIELSALSSRILEEHEPKN